MKQHIINVDSDKCIGCGLCKKDCALNNIQIADKKAVIKGQKCSKCGHCVAICPKSAISISGFDEQSTEFSERTILEPDKLLQAIKTRRSIRYFKAEDVFDEVIKNIIEAGRFTPTALNAQNVSYIVIKDGKEKIEKTAFCFFKKIWGIASVFTGKTKGIDIDEHYLLKNAPVTIAIVSKSKVNGSLAASNMALMAESYGLGVLYGGLFTIVANYSRKLRKIMGLKCGEKVVTTLALGYPDVKYHRTAQREIPFVRYL